MNRCARSILIGLLLTTVLPALALAQFGDRVGVYFDTDYHVTEAYNTDVPHLATAYLVLHDPTQIAGGLGGWECRVEFEGYQPAVQWFLNGETYNFMTPPDFVVGMTDPLPITGPDVLLASFDMFINETTPFQIELVPLRSHPSIEDAMSYIPWDDKEALTPMATTTNVPAVATYNWVPNCEVDGAGIIFGEVQVGLEVIDSITVTNAGGGILLIDPVITGSEYFTLGTVSYPVALYPGQSYGVTVHYIPLATGTHTATLDLGTACDALTLAGLGREPVVAYRFDPPAADFGTVMVGELGITTVRIFNEGDVPLNLDPGEACDDFSTPSGAGTISVGGSGTVTLHLSPTAAGIYACDFVLGSQFEPYHAVGEGALGSEVLVPNAPDLDFGYTQPGGSNLRTIIVTNTSDHQFYLFPTLDDPSGAFRLVNPTLLLFPAGFARSVDIRFEPQAAGEFGANLGFDGTDFALPLHGVAGEPDSNLVVSPTYVDFGEVVFLGFAERSVWVTNQSEWPIDIVPSLEPAYPHFAIVSGGDPITLAAGSSREIVVRCTPQTDEGVISATLRLGLDHPTALLIAQAVSTPTDVVVDPEIVQFGTLPLGQTLERTVTIQNTGQYPLTTNLFIYPPYSPFFFVAGQDITEILPGETANIVVGFRPTSVGIWSHELHLGDFHPPVILNGRGQDVLADCTLSTTDLVFPFTEIGSSSLRTVTVFNNGPEFMDIVPSINCQQFAVVTPPSTVQPGESLDVTVVFTPTYEGPIICVLYLGENACDIVQLHGNGGITGLPGDDEDLVGIYFDESYQMPGYAEARLGVPFDGYLVLRNPSLPEDITGWEMRMVLENELFLAMVELTGGGFNYQTPPEFTVGLSSPLPATEYILLATFTFMPAAVFEATTISLVPNYTPSIPGYMACTSGPEHELRPIQTTTGEPVVAWVSWYESSVGNDDPGDQPDLPDAPLVTQLLPNVPNPFNPETTIHFELAVDGHLRIEVFDVMGRRVARLMDGHRSAGPDRVTWQGRDDRGRTLPSGAYYVRLETAGTVDTRKVMLLK